MATTVSINVRDRTVASLSNVNIAIINQPNPVENYVATADEVWQLIQLPKYDVRDASTNILITGSNYYDYFPTSSGGGGDGSKLISKSINKNGAYRAKDDKADGYSSVDVSVSNSYTIQDEGKVVSGGELVSQSSSSATSNGTVDTTLINSIEINVPNSYTPSDEGKVVIGSTLVQQTSDTTTQNGTVDTTTISSLTVNVPSGGGGAEKKAVNFIDYDGTIVHSYTAAEFAELTEFPSNPSHDGLTAQGWNWSTFAKAKAYVAKYGKLDIGQKYRVTDGKTRIFIELDEYRREPVLGLGVNGSVDIDWGDGSEHTTLTGTNVSIYVNTQPHTYPSGGEYVITLTITGTANFLEKGIVNESGNYRNAIKRVSIGDSITTISSTAFGYCYSLSSVTIPDSVTTISSTAFGYCYSLSSIIIPDSVTTIGTYAFQNCNSLSSIIIPDSVTVISSYAFRNCYSLSSVTIPDSVTTISSYAFNSCNSLGSVKFEKATPPTVQNSNAFSGIPTDCTILVKSYAYLSASNYPSPSTYTYAYYDTIADGTALPATIPDDSTTSLTWYATIADLRAETNPITVGNGKEVYAKMVAL